MAEPERMTLGDLFTRADTLEWVLRQAEQASPSHRLSQLNLIVGGITQQEEILICNKWLISWIAAAAFSSMTAYCQE